jgi:hypothetical protein
MDDVWYTCLVWGNFMYCSLKLLSRKCDDRISGKTIPGTFYINMKINAMI